VKSPFTDGTAVHDRDARLDSAIAGIAPTSVTIIIAAHPIAAFALLLAIDRPVPSMVIS
jgi:hypothetical protein